MSDRSVQTSPPSTTRTARRPAPERPKLRLEWIRAGSLADHPSNWRRHPEEQMRALGAALADREIGWAGALLMNERTGRLIDGHARRDEIIRSAGPEALVPVLVGSWSPAAERRILATLDPIGDMAEPDAEALRRLLDQVRLPEDSFEALQNLLAELAAAPNPADAGADAVGGSAGDPAQRERVTYILTVECRSERQQRRLRTELEGRGLRVKVHQRICVAD